MSTTPTPSYPAWRAIHETGRYTLLTDEHGATFLLVRAQDHEPVAWFADEDAESLGVLFALHQEAGTSVEDIDRLLLAQYDFMGSS